LIAGLILSDSLSENCSIAFLEDEIEVMKLETNKDIAEEVEERGVEILAVDVGTAQSGDEFTRDEEELKEEGFIFTPNSHQQKKVERMQSLEKRLKHATGGELEVIRFEPQITARELAVDSESDLNSLGIQGEIGDAEEFDAVLGAVTARFYDQGQFKDLGVVVPENLANS
jgi:hypothetical protein